MTFAPDLSDAPGMQPLSGARKAMNQDMGAIRNYVMGEDGRQKAESTVLLHVSHSNLKKTFFQEIRLDMHMTIDRVKHKLEFHTGSSAVSCQVNVSPIIAPHRNQHERKNSLKNYMKSFCLLC